MSQTVDERSQNQFDLFVASSLHLGMTFPFQSPFTAFCNASPRPHIMIISLGCVWGFGNSIFINFFMVGISDRLLHSIGFFPKFKFIYVTEIKGTHLKCTRVLVYLCSHLQTLVMFSIHRNITNKYFSFQ